MSNEEQSDKIDIEYNQQRDLHPSEQWVEELYQTLVSKPDVPERCVGITGLGNDETVYVSTSPSCQVTVRLVLQELGYDPELVHDLAYAISPDFTPDS